MLFPRFSSICVTYLLITFCLHSKNTGSTPGDLRPPWGLDVSVSVWTGFPLGLLCRSIFRTSFCCSPSPFPDPMSSSFLVYFRIFPGHVLPYLARKGCIGDKNSESLNIWTSVYSYLWLDWWLREVRSSSKSVYYSTGDSWTCLCNSINMVSTRNRKVSEWDMRKSKQG